MIKPQIIIPKITVAIITINVFIQAPFFLLKR